MTLGAASNQEVEEIEKATEEEDDAAAAAARRGQILWVRGLSRLQHQVFFSPCIGIYLASLVPELVCGSHLVPQGKGKGHSVPY